MNTIGYHFHCHIVYQIDTFYCTFIFILTALMEARHRIIEMCSMRITGLPGCTDIFIFGLCMCHRSQDAFSCDILTKLHGTRQFGCSIPTLDTAPLLYNRNIFLRIRVFYVFRHLTACHLHIKVMPFKMKTKYRTVRFRHQPGTSFGSCLNHRYGRRRQRWENTGSTMFHVSINGCTESLFRTFHKITATTTMTMDFHTTGNNIHTFSVNQLGSDNS